MVFSEKITNISNIFKMWHYPTPEELKFRKEYYQELKNKNIYDLTDDEFQDFMDIKANLDKWEEHCFLNYELYDYFENNVPLIFEFIKVKKLVIQTTEKMKTYKFDIFDMQEYHRLVNLEEELYKKVTNFINYINFMCNGWCPVPDGLEEIISISDFIPNFKFEDIAVLSNDKDILWFLVDYGYVKFNYDRYFEKMKIACQTKEIDNINNIRDKVYFFIVICNYLKKIFYGNYVRNILLPWNKVQSYTLGITGNPTGIKNTGKNETKLYNSRVRSQRNCIQKAIHNFSDCKNMGLLTLTYAEYLQDVKKANYHFKLFIKGIKYHFSKYKKNKYKDLKYLVAYEYQETGRVHFHILFSEHIPNKIVRKYWPYGYNKNLPVKKGTNEFVSKYVAKYIVKAQSEAKSKNIYDLNMKAYRFSANCTDPIIEKGKIELCLDEIEELQLKSNFYKPFKSEFNQELTIGAIIDSSKENDTLKEYQKCRLELFYKKQWKFKEKIVMESSKKIYRSTDKKLVH